MENYTKDITTSIENILDTSFLLLLSNSLEFDKDTFWNSTYTMPPILDNINDATNEIVQDLYQIISLDNTAKEKYISQLTALKIDITSTLHTLNKYVEYISLLTLIAQQKFLNKTTNFSILSQHNIHNTIKHAVAYLLESSSQYESSKNIYSCLYYDINKKEQLDQLHNHLSTYAKHNSINDTILLLDKLRAVSTPNKSLSYGTVLPEISLTIDDIYILLKSTNDATVLKKQITQLEELNSSVLSLISDASILFENINYCILLISFMTDNTDNLILKDLFYSYIETKQTKDELILEQLEELINDNLEEVLENIDINDNNINTLKEDTFNDLEFEQLIAVYDSILEKFHEQFETFYDNNLAYSYNTTNLDVNELLSIFIENLDTDTLEYDNDNIALNVIFSRILLLVPYELQPDDLLNNLTNYFSTSSDTNKCMSIYNIRTLLDSF